jgi:hypothetical protein
MATKTNIQLKADLDSNIATNGSNTITGAIVNAYETDAIDSKVSRIDDEIIAGIKSFNSFPITPHSYPTDDFQVANKIYVDNIADTFVPYLPPKEVSLLNL